jgi:hypothetical protein
MDTAKLLLIDPTGDRLLCGLLALADGDLTPEP